MVIGPHGKACQRLCRDVLGSPSAIRQRLADVCLEAIRKLAGEVGMGVTALVEHLYNVDLINDAEREQLRQF